MKIAWYLYLCMLIAIAAGYWWLKHVDSVATSALPQVIDTPPPAFSDYPVVVSNERTTPAPINWSSHPNARQFKTAIERAQLSGPVFAGKYAHAAWGCGTECQGHALIDTTTGNIIAYGFGSSYWIDVRTDSRLLVLNPPHEIARLGTSSRPVYSEYYVLDGEVVRFLERRDHLGKIVLCEPDAVLTHQVATGVWSKVESACAVPLGWEILAQSEGILTGTATRAYTCLESGCPEEWVVAFAQNGTTEVERVRVDDRGGWSMVLSEGTYIIDLLNNSEWRASEFPAEVTVERGTIVTLLSTIEEVPPSP
jgi:hypothetical protein